MRYKFVKHSDKSNTKRSKGNEYIFIDHKNIRKHETYSYNIMHTKKYENMEVTVNIKIKTIHSKIKDKKKEKEVSFNYISFLIITRIINIINNKTII